MHHGGVFAGAQAAVGPDDLKSVAVQVHRMPHVFGARPSAVATLVDRATRYAMVVAPPDGNKADAVARALIDHMGRLPEHLRRPLTWDRGSEMARTVVRQLLALTITATVSASIEDASVLRALLRNTVGGGFALAVTFAIGHLVSTGVS